MNMGAAYLELRILSVAAGRDRSRLVGFPCRKDTKLGRPGRQSSPPADGDSSLPKDRFSVLEAR